MAQEAEAFLRELGRLRSHDLGAECVHATWEAQAFVPFWRQRLSVALHSGTALELARVLSSGEAKIRAIAARKPLL